LGHKAKLKQWPVFGAFDSAERSESLDMLGLSSLLIFPTIGVSRFVWHNNPDVSYGECDALNCAMVDFCKDEKRMLPLAFMVVTDQERAVQGAKDALKMGVRALWIGRYAIEWRAPSESAYDPLWAVPEEAGVPVTLHLGSGGNMGGARGRLNILPS
jgi:hypothetical protein